MQNPRFEKLDVSWRLIRRDGTVITPENLPAGASVIAEWRQMDEKTVLGSFSYNGLTDVEYIHFPYSTA